MVSFVKAAYKRIMTENIYPDIFEVIKIANDQNCKMRDFCNTTPEPRKTLYGAMFRSLPDKFFPLKMPSGETRLTPYQPSIWLYRGQTVDHGECLPSLHRKKPYELDLFVARIKHIQFESVLLDHPAVIDIIKSSFNVNFKGLAQHYSLKTEKKRNCWTSQVIYWLPPSSPHVPILWKSTNICHKLIHQLELSTKPYNWRYLL